MKQIKVKKNDVSNSDHHDGVNLYHQKRTRRLSVSSMCLKTRNLGIQEKIELYPSLLFFWIHQHIPDIYNMNSIR